MMGKLTRTYLVSLDTVLALYVMHVHMLCTYVYFIYVCVSAYVTLLYNVCICRYVRISVYYVYTVEEYACTHACMHARTHAHLCSAAHCSIGQA